MQYEILKYAKRAAIGFLAKYPPAVAAAILLYPSEIGPEWPHGDNRGGFGSLGNASIPPVPGPGSLGSSLSLVDLLTNEGFDPEDEVAFFHGTTSTSPLVAGEGIRQGSVFFVTSSRDTAAVFAARIAARYGGNPTAVMFVLPKETFRLLQTSGLVVRRPIDLGGIEHEFAAGAADVLNQFGSIIPLDGGPIR